MALENIPSAAPAPTPESRSATAASGNSGAASGGIAGGPGTAGALATTAAAPGAQPSGSTSASATAGTAAQGFQSVMAGVSAQGTPDTAAVSPALPLPFVVAPVIPAMLPANATVAGASTPGKAAPTAPAPVTLPKPAPIIIADVTPTVTVDPLIAGARATVPAATTSPPGIAKPTNSKAAAKSASDERAEAATAADAAAALAAAAMTLPAAGLQTLPAPAASTATAAPAAQTSAVTDSSTQSEAAAEQADLNAALALSNGSGAKSLTPPAARPVRGDAEAVMALADIKSLSAADHSSSPAPAAQATALHAAFMHSQSAADFDPSPTLRAPIGSDAWTEELGTHLTWMSRNGQESGSLHVAPEHLGPVEVRIEVRDGSASVWFGAAHPATRAALEHALPRLHEMFAASGLQLADSGVARDAPRQNAKPVTPVIGQVSHGIASNSISSTPAPRSRSGILDTYV